MTDSSTQIPPGSYDVQVDLVENLPSGTVRITYRITTKGPQEGAKLILTYDRTARVIQRKEEEAPKDGF